MKRSKDNAHRAKGSDDEQYNEAEDEDYNPQQVGADEDISSSDEEAAPTTVKTSKRKIELTDELDSGDEATIRERKKKKTKKQEADASDGEGGLIKTRSQRLAEKSERRKERRQIGGEATVDVEGLWNQLHALPIGASSTAALDSIQKGTSHQDVPPTALPEEYITITRRIKFAGQTTEVEEQVLRTSDEAQRYLAEQEQATDTELQSRHDGLQKPLRRMSLFEPNPLGIVKGIPPDKLRRRAPSRMDMAMAERRAEDEQRRRAEKLSTMQKTALDWKGFVIEQGLGQELDEYGKSKKGFLAREQFLDKVHGANEVARRTARLKA